MSEKRYDFDPKYLNIFSMAKKENKICNNFIKVKVKNNSNDVNAKNLFFKKGEYPGIIKEAKDNGFTFNSHNLIKESSMKKNPEEVEDTIDKEEPKIEDALTTFNNVNIVQHIKNEKLYEIKIENLQYLDYEEDYKKYISIGGGIFSFEITNDLNGKKVGIFILRECSTKQNKLQGIIINSLSPNVEKAKTKHGIECILIKNIIVKYNAYPREKMKEEKTKLTFLRIRIKKNETDNFCNKIKQFFELFKN